MIYKCAVTMVFELMLIYLKLVLSVVFRAVRRNISGRECLYADGGILDQYPISWFDGM